MYVLNFTLFGTCIWLLTSYVITSTTIKLYRYSAAPNEVNVGMIWYVSDVTLISDHTKESLRVIAPAGWNPEYVNDVTD